MLLLILYSWLFTLFHLRYISMNFINILYTQSTLWNLNSSSISVRMITLLIQSYVLPLILLQSFHLDIFINIIAFDLIHLQTLDANIIAYFSSKSLATLMQLANVPSRIDNSLILFSSKFLLSRSRLISPYQNHEYPMLLHTPYDNPGNFFTSPCLPSI